MKQFIQINGIWLRRFGDEVQVLVEIDGAWRLVITENIDSSFSHIVEPSGINNSPVDQL